ncbi:hypothetical protein GFM13_29815 [Rhizobium leguminosarum bv. viciae]|nr:hypothetical protein [Rhizobium leguminosarum bv. viciae]
MSRNGLWSALQTHLQGVDGTTLAKLKIILHCVILLSQKSCVIQITLPAKRGKRAASTPIAGRRELAGDHTITCFHADHRHIIQMVGYRIN